MRSSNFMVVILWLFLQGDSSLAGGDQEIDLISKINLLENQLKWKDEQIKLKDEQIKFKDEHIQMKDEQITDKVDQIQYLKELSKLNFNNSDHQREQYEARIKNLEAEIIQNVGKLNATIEEIELLRGKCDPRSCLPFVNSTGIHFIRLPGVDPFNVPCNSSVSGSGWTVIQRRVNGNVDFNRNWNDYKHGFGNLQENFFLGLEKIHQMTLEQPHELYIQLGMVNGSMGYARFDDFKIGSEEEGYELKSLGKYSGTAGDSLTEVHLNMKFSTFDRDNDIAEDGNCAKWHGGGWWFSKCAYSNLNGNYYKDGKISVKPRNGIDWGTWYNYDWNISLTFSQIMIRPKTL